MKTGNPSASVIERVKLFHTDSVICGLSALALKTNAPNLLRDEALAYSIRGSHQPGYSFVFGSKKLVPAEKAIAANASAVREWDSNGTVFGFNDKIPGHQAGEFGHNDYYPVVISACQQNLKMNGQDAVRAMVLLDEIRGRLAEVYSLKTYKIDHVVHGAVASAATYGAMMGATAEQIEHAIGMFCAHYIPYRAIRAGKQLSDSKGASAALSSEVAIMSMRRAMAGFVGPKDIFRNPEAFWRLNEPTNGDSPFDLSLSTSGDDFSLMGMHFKLGLYEHQSAGAIQAIIDAISHNNFLGDLEAIKKIEITAYEPAFGIIGDPAKRNPTTRQSADHSMVYIISTLIRKASEKAAYTKNWRRRPALQIWKDLMLEPIDYGYDAVFNPVTRQLMDKIQFVHGGEEYDRRYPDGIPTRVQIQANDKTFDSGMVMYPGGHARNTTIDLKNVLNHKNNLLGKLGLSTRSLNSMVDKLQDIENLNNDELQRVYDANILFAEKSIDEQ